ncbi:MAG: FHA domain-containing protein [Pirellulales bacterium]|nr:FHA domain-containing protein [Pirellulales bacterium]
MDVKLIVVSAKTGTKEILVKRPRIIGRAQGIGVVIPHPSVSERHCLLFDNAGLLMVQDLNSAQGTFVGGRKIVMAPLPPGAEFTVGPLTLRAEYSYLGNLDALPKTLYEEPETEPAPAPMPAAQEPNPPRPQDQWANEIPERRESEAPAEPNGAGREIPSFFGFGSNEGFPAVAQPAGLPEVSFAPPSEPSSPRPPADFPAISAKKPAPPTPPPLPKIVAEAPKPEFAQGPNFGHFAGAAGTDDEGSSAPGDEPALGIPGLVLDADIPNLPPIPPEPPAKKKSVGSLLDYFGKRPSRRKRAARLPIDNFGPPAGAGSDPPAAAGNASAAIVKPDPSAAKGDWSKDAPKYASAPPLPPETSAEPSSAPPERVDDDLSSFFKKLE